jgi:hypothetical protein
MNNQIKRKEKKRKEKKRKERKTNIRKILYIAFESKITKRVKKKEKEEDHGVEISSFKLVTLILY